MKSYQRTGPGGFGFVPKKPKLSVLTKCPECGYVMKERAKRTTVTYKDHSKYVTVTAIWCTRCPEGLLDTKATKQMDVAYQKLKKEVDTKPLSTPQLRQHLLGPRSTRPGRLLGRHRGAS
jgi:YgiT-type zinc finger domain-containing protein